jgi:hypothetical protein
VVQTFFAAATGGSTQNNEDVWGGTPRSYLRSVPDPWSIAPPEAVTVSAWSPRVRSQAVVAKAFGLPDVASLDLSDRFASGGLRTVVATSTSGAKATLSGEKFRSTMVSDSGTTLMSTWVWRSVVSPKVTTPATVLPETVGNRLSEFAQVPMRSARQAVIVQSDKRDLVALASAYAGNTQSYLVLVRPTADASRVSQLLKTQQISSAVIIGEIDPAVRTVIPTTVGVTNLAGVSVNELSQKLASLLKAKPAHGVVLASTSEPSSLPLAVSLAVRTNRPLIVNDSPELSPETAAWLVNYSPGSITIVGSSSAISDSAVAGFPNATRLNTADLPIAAATILNIKPATHRSLTVIGTGTNLTSAIVLAALGNPILYPDADVTASIVPWLRRQHLLTLIINGGGSADFVETIRRA